MDTEEGVPPAFVREAIALLRDDGVLVPATVSMRRWLERAGCTSFDELPISSAQRAALVAGDRCVAAVDGEAFEFELRSSGDQQCLAVTPCDDDRRLHASRLAAARARHLASSASRLVHDLNNQFSAMMALSAHLAIDANASPADHAERRDMEQATKAGSKLLVALARLLGANARDGERVLVDPVELVQSALAIESKKFEVAQARLHEPQLLAGGSQVRVDAVLVVQAVVAGLSALLQAGAKDVHTELSCRELEIAGGRARPAVCLRITATDVAPESARQLVDVVVGASEALQLVAKRPGSYDGLPGARLAQQLFGGDLDACEIDGGVRLDYVWAAARVRSASS